MIRTTFVAALAVSAAWLLLAARAADQDLPVPEIEKIVRDYLMREPEVIYEAIQELQKRQQTAEAERQKATIAKRRRDLRHPEDPIAGAADGDVTLVEFFDYRCGYRWSMAGNLRTLVDTDDHLRFVFKELPVSARSVVAAKAALAARSITTGITISIRH